MTNRLAGLVSVVVPVHERPELLREAVASALTQEYRPLEVVIVDDASRDATPAVAAALAGEEPERVRLVRLAVNVGPGAAREAGRRAARGEFEQYLDSDDLLLPGKLARQVAGLGERPDAGVSYGWTRSRRRDGSETSRPFRRSGVRFATMFPAFLAERVWSTSSPLYRASVVEAAGGWSDLRLEEDWELDCRVAALGTRLQFVDDWVSEHRDHAGPRAGREAPFAPAKLAERARAHLRILDSARRAGIDAEAPEMARFARTLFLLARQCAAAGLAPAANRPSPRRAAPRRRGARAGSTSGSSPPRPAPSAGGGRGA